MNSENSWYIVIFPFDDTTFDGFQRRKSVETEVCMKRTYIIFINTMERTKKMAKKYIQVVMDHYTNIACLVDTYPHLRRFEVLVHKSDLWQQSPTLLGEKHRH